MKQTLFTILVLVNLMHPYPFITKADSAVIVPSVYMLADQSLSLTLSMNEAITYDLP